MSQLQLYRSWSSLLFFLISAILSLSLGQSSSDPYGIVPPACSQSFDGRTETRLSTLLPSLPVNDPLVISCGTKLIIDAGISANIPGGLVIEGHAEIENLASSSETVIAAPWILVKGHFRVGWAGAPYLGILKILLTDSSAPLIVPHPDSRFSEYTSYATKAFVVHGGSVSIHAPDNGPVYTVLSRTAVQGESRIHVAADMVGVWNKQDVIGVSHTTMVWGTEDDAYFGLIQKLKRKRKGHSILFTKPHLRRMYTVRHLEVRSPGKNLYDVDMAAEVVRLNRRVVITGSESESNLLPNWYKSSSVGASFVIAHSDMPQHIEGVEFSAVGQAGVWGAYPIFFKFCGPSASITLKRNSIHHSKNRCVVITGTNNVKVEENVAFRTAGHCYVVEDGLERANMFEGNVALAVRPAIQKISSGDITTEHDPCGFWLACADNGLKNNVVGGARGCGFWYELHDRARGSSKKLQLPGWDTYEIRRGPLRLFENNLAHSTYSGVKSHELWATERATLKGFVAWTVGVGWYAGWSSNQVLTGAHIVDVFYRGINAQSIERIRIENSSLAGELYSDWACTRDEESTGIWIEAIHHFNAWNNRLGGIEIDGVHFQDFIKTRNCKRNYAIKILIGRDNYWFPSASYLNKASFYDVDYPLAITYATENHLQFGFELRDRSLPTYENGYLISEGFESDSVATEGCQSLGSALSGTLLCPSQCWRHVSLAWSNPENVSKLLLSKVGQELSFTPRVIHQWVQYQPGKWKKFTRLVTVIIPAGQYDLTLLDNDNGPVDTGLYDQGSFLYIRADVRDGSSTCNENVDIRVHSIVVEGT